MDFQNKLDLKHRVHCHEHKFHICSEVHHCGNAVIEFRLKHFSRLRSRWLHRYSCSKATLLRSRLDSHHQRQAPDSSVFTLRYNSNIIIRRESSPRELTLRGVCTKGCPATSSHTSVVKTFIVFNKSSTILTLWASVFSRLTPLKPFCHASDCLA
jgi:hypothetical protein